jgi:hypothetical protein
MLMFVTKKDLNDKLIKYIEKEHSYSVPVVAVCDIKLTSQPYSFWIENILSNKEKYVIETEAEIKDRNEKGYHYDRLK